MEELPLFELEGDGPHSYLLVEKRLANTEDVARALAQAVGLAPREVGYAGRKDRIAITRQWFSLPTVGGALDEPTSLGLSERLRGEGEASVLSVVRHRHKLRTGQLRGNRFEIRVRGLDADAREAARQRAEDVARHGFANRFGDQRFGRGGGNLEAGRAILAGRKPPKMARREARFLVSALQAAVFNEVLRARPLPLDRVEVGEIAVVAASGGPFLVEDAELDSERAARLEIHPSGPIFGTRRLRPEGAAAVREADAHAVLGLPAPDDVVAPRGMRMKGGRRALRAVAAGLAASEEGEDLWLRFELAAGSYATVLLEELVGPFEEGPTAESAP